MIRNGTLWSEYFKERNIFRFRWNSAIYFYCYPLYDLCNFDQLTRNGMTWNEYFIERNNSSLLKIQQNISCHLLHHFRLILNYVQGMLQSKKSIMNSFHAKIAITHRSRNIWYYPQFILKQKTHGIWRSPKYHSP